MSVIINKSTNDKVVVSKTATETIKVATGIKGDVGATGPVGPVGPVGDPGVHVGPTPPADTDLLWVDTSATITAGASQQILGLADPQDYDSLPKVLIDRGDSISGWVVVNGNGLRVDSSFGVGSEAVTAQLSNGPASNVNLTAALYKNLSTPLSTGGHSAIVFDLRTAFYFHTSKYLPPHKIIAATGPNLTGTLYSAYLHYNASYNWTKAWVPVPNNVTISSIGIKTADTTGPFFSDQEGLWIRDMYLDSISGVQAAQIGDKTPIVTEYADTSLNGFIDPITNSPKLDLRRDSAVLPGLGNWWDVREWGIPEDEVTDVSPLLNKIIKDLPSGAHLKFPTGRAFLVKSQIQIEKPITIDFNDCILYDNERRGAGQSYDNDFICVTNGATDVTLLNGNIFATWYDPFTAGGKLETVSGTVTTVGTTAVLDTVGSAGEFRPRVFSGNPYLRWMAQHYEPGYGVINRYDTNIQGDGISTVLLEVWTDDGVKLASSTVIPPVSGASYTLRCNPPVLTKRLYLRITKVSGTGSIVINTVTPWGISDYQGAYEGSNGLTVYDASRVVVDNWRIENTGGEGIVFRTFNFTLGDITFKNIHCRCNHTQNYAITSGKDIKVINCVSEASGRTGFDIEPYGPGWLVSGISILNCSSVNDRNFSLSCSNWFLIEDLIIENFTAKNWGFGAFTGGARGGKITNFNSIDVDPSWTGQDMAIQGNNMIVNNLYLSHGFSLYDDPVTYSGTTYACFGNTVSNFVISKGNPTWPSSQIKFKDTTGFTSTLSGGAYGTFDPPLTNSTPGTYTTGAYIIGRPNLMGLELGKWRTALPNLYKGLAMDGQWWPYGVPAHEGVVKARGISATSVKPKNLRGVNVPVATGVYSSTVAFATDSSGVDFAPVSGTSALTIAPVVYAGTGTPSLTFGVPYYYALCARVAFDDYGHKPSAGFIKTGTALSVGFPVYSVQVRGQFNFDKGNLVAGFDIYRGSTGNASTGPWDTRYTVTPSSPWFSTNNALGLFDIGTELRSNSALSNRMYGYPNLETQYGVVATAQTGNWTTLDGPFTDRSGYEYDTNYSIQITPSWVTTVAVVAKRQSGFDVEFGTPAPAGATFDWVLIR